MISKWSDRREVLYGKWQEQAVFMLWDTARLHVVSRHAVENASTWGELKAMLQDDPEAYRRFLDVTAQPGSTD